MATPHRGQGSIGLLLALLFAGMTAVASAADRQAVEGRWYGELSINSSYGGKPFDFRRWLRVNDADGSGQTTMRYYLGTQFQTETVEKFQWGVTGDTYWEECISVKDEEGDRSCANRTEYDIKRLTDREFQNVSKRSGLEYREIKVPAQFTLP